MRSGRVGARAACRDLRHILPSSGWWARSTARVGGRRRRRGGSGPFVASGDVAVPPSPRPRAPSSPASANPSDRRVRRVCAPPCENSRPRCRASAALGAAAPSRRRGLRGRASRPRSALEGRRSAPPSWSASRRRRSSSAAAAPSPCRAARCCWRRRAVGDAVPVREHGHRDRRVARLRHLQGVRPSPRGGGRERRRSLRRRGRCADLGQLQEARQPVGRRGGAGRR